MTSAVSSVPMSVMMSTVTPGMRKYRLSMAWLYQMRGSATALPGSGPASAPVSGALTELSVRSAAQRATAPSR